MAAAWFGPRGFASVVYGLLVLGSGVRRAPFLFHIISIVIIGSMIAHSTTDTPIARWFQKQEAKNTSKQNHDEETIPVQNQQPTEQEDRIRKYQIG